MVGEDGREERRDVAEEAHGVNRRVQVPAQGPHGVEVAGRNSGRQWGGRDRQQVVGDKQGDEASEIYLGEEAAIYRIQTRVRIVS